MGGLQSTERSLSATASKGLSALRAVTDLCCAVNQRLTSVVREIRTLRSVGAGGFGPRRPGGTATAAPYPYPRVKSRHRLPRFRYTEYSPRPLGYTFSHSRPLVCLMSIASTVPGSRHRALILKPSGCERGKIG